MKLTSFFCIFYILTLFCAAGRTHLDFPNRKHLRTIRHREENRVWNLKETYTGSGFLDGWDFFTGPDPTNGLVAYQSKADAMAKGLAYVKDDGTTVLAVDDKTFLPLGAKRDSVRISTKKKFDGGLFLADFWKMPVGCSTWPAYWSLFPTDWPKGGEIDILEGVHNQPTNQYTLHTSPGCTLSTGNISVATRITHQDCSSSANSNAGCGFVDSDTRSYGHGFNSIGGGVFAHLWNAEGIKIWHFPRTQIPTDISSRKPSPATWGAPVAFWSAETCDMASHFYEHVLVLDTTLCGDYGAATFSSAGCPGNCAQMVTDPNNYHLAKWELNYISVYQ